MVDMTGLEPAPISGLVSKTSAAANYATCRFYLLWSGWWDLNPQPHVSKTCILPD